MSGPECRGGRWRARVGFSAAGKTLGVGVGLVGGVLGAAEEGAFGGFADDHGAGAAGLTDGWGGLAGGVGAAGGAAGGG